MCRLGGGVYQVCRLFPPVSNETLGAGRGPQTSLKTLFSGKDVSLKLASLGQAIVQATRGNPL